jgi:RHS repeat-associated protein
MRYYYNYNWQVLCDYDDSNNLYRGYVYGNYIDEVLLGFGPTTACLYSHDHLYSPAALTDIYCNLVERYEYDAYGKCTIMDASYNTRSESQYKNPYYFQGKRLDVLDDGSFKLMVWPYRDYSTYLGRWLQAEKLGMIPNDYQETNLFSPTKQYLDGMNLYQYVGSSPINGMDTLGLLGVMPDPFPPSKPEKKKTCPLHLYNWNERFIRRTVIRRSMKKEELCRWVFSIGRMNIGTIRNRMAQRCCDCIDEVSVYDHGTLESDPNGIVRGRQCFGDEPGPGPYLGGSDLKKLCPLLCQNTTVVLYGCYVGEGSRRGFQHLFNACTKIVAIRACKGRTDYYPSSGKIKCHGGWKTFWRFFR